MWNTSDFLGTRSTDERIETSLDLLETLSRPAFDEEDDFQHYDWVLVRRKGIELGFVDEAYFRGEPKPLWRSNGMILCQITYYNDTREGVNPYTGELPYGLMLADTKQEVHKKLIAFENTRHSHVTDRWNIDNYRLIVAYKDGGELDSVHVKLPVPPLPEKYREQPTVTFNEWLTLFGSEAQSESLTKKLVPLDLAQRIDDDEDEREVEFLEECGLTVYFEENRKLRLPTTNKKSTTLVFGAVKFHRARDLESRQYIGELPFGLSFDDSPETLFKKIPHKPGKQSDGPTTGRALWHFDEFSLNVLYSTIENHLFRVMVMAPGYWQDFEDM
jgi:hypothetical protein